MTIVPPSCEHGPRVWKTGAFKNPRPDGNTHWTAWFCPVRKDAGPYIEPCKAIFGLTKETMTKRIYNPETSKYELPKPVDPWAGAPAEALAKGIRLFSNEWGPAIWTDTHAYWKTNLNFKQWTPQQHLGLQHCLDVNRGRGYRFPDFDGAPEGVRFYVRNDLFSDSKSPWRPRVSIGGQVFTRISTGDWKPVGQHATIEWYRDNRSNSWSAVMVDECPSEASGYEPPTANVEPPQTITVVKSRNSLPARPSASIMKADRDALRHAWDVLEFPLSTRVELHVPGVNVVRYEVTDVRLETQDGGQTVKVFAKAAEGTSAKAAA